MGIKTRIQAPVKNTKDILTEKLFREERDYRTDRLVEKWSSVPEVGNGIQDMNTAKARNLAVLLENQTRAMSRLTEAQLASQFGGYSPKYTWEA